jgi:hypothetical protein
MSDERIAEEAERMKNWAADRGKTGANWDARFNNWLIEGARRNPPPKPERFSDYMPGSL